LDVCSIKSVSKIFIEVEVYLSTVEVYLSDLKGEIMEERKVPERM